MADQNDELRLTFGVLDASQITDDMVISIADDNGELPEDASLAWEAATNYTVATRVHRATTHRIYDRLVAGATATPPESDTVNWKDMGPTRRWSAFDLYRSTKLVGTGELVIKLRPRRFVTAAWLGGVVATEASVEVRDGLGGPVVLPETAVFLAAYGRNDWQSFFLAPNVLLESAYWGGIPLCGDPVVTIRLRQLGGAPQVGTIQVGQFLALGRTDYGTDVGRVRYSTVEFKADGTMELIPRPSGGDVNLNVEVPFAQKDMVDYVMGQYDARPVLYVGHTDNEYALLNKFGLFEGRLRFTNAKFLSLSGTVTGTI